MEETAAAGHVDVGAELLGQHGSDMSGLYGVLELVLAVAVAILEPPQHLDDLWVQAGRAGLYHCLFAGLLDGGLHLFLGLLHHGLAAGGMDAAVADEAGEGYASGLPPPRGGGGGGGGEGGGVGEE